MPKEFVHVTVVMTPEQREEIRSRARSTGTTVSRYFKLAALGDNSADHKNDSC